MTRRASRERVTKETSIRISLDVDGSGRGEASTGLPFFDHMLSQLGKHGGFDPGADAIGTPPFDPHMAEHFWQSFANAAAITLHVRLISGRNPHHIIEASFKGVARALRDAVRVEVAGGDVPSTKGQL